MSPTLNITQVDDQDAIATEAAEHLLARLDAARTKAVRPPAVCLTGGSTPKRLYELLGSPRYRSRIAWDDVHWFIGDDRFVPVSDPLNNMAMARRLFLDRCAPAANIHPIPMDAENADAAAKLYEQILQRFYGATQLDAARPLFDIVLLGIGPDGHTASLFPGAPALEEKIRWVCGVDKANVAPFVARVTLTFPALASCREMMFLVSGAEKCAILSRVRGGEDLPATHARSVGLTTWLVDAAAAGPAP
jgi:6-phosphogluconolactonase